MEVKTVDANTLKQWIDNKEAVVIDVREPAEYQAENIECATLVPLGNICKQALPEAKNKKIVIHCLAGKRGTSACQKLLAEDPSLELYNLEGGIKAWVSAGNKVRCMDKTSLPLERQVQLALGILVLLGVLLAYYVAPIFNIILGLLGIGLIFAGLTGCCCLTVLLAKMPWNKGCKILCGTKQA